MFNEEKVKEIYKKIYNEKYKAAKEWCKENFSEGNAEEHEAFACKMADQIAKTRLSRDFQTFLDRITKD